MKFNKKTLNKSLNIPGPDKKSFTKNRKQNVILSEEQFDRLSGILNENNYNEIVKTIEVANKLIRESITKEGLNLNISDYSEVILEQGMYDRNPGVAAGEGIENILNGIKKAYDMIKDSETRKKLANSITKLGNFMAYTAELIGSGAPGGTAPRSYKDVSDDLPYPEGEDTIQEQKAAIGDYVEGKGVYKGDDQSGNAIYSKKEEEVNETAKKSCDECGEAPCVCGDKEEVKEDSGHDEAMNYGRDEGHDDKELYNLKHDGGSEDHIDGLEDDMHYDRIHDSEHIEESKEERERLIREDIKKMKQVIKPISKI